MTRVEFICPRCQQSILAPSSLAGTDATCPRCEVYVTRWPAPVITVDFLTEDSPPPVHNPPDDEPTGEIPDDDPPRRKARGGFLDRIRLATGKEILASVGGIFLLLVVSLAIMSALRGSRSSVEVQYADWLITAHVTGQGEEWAHEVFSPAFIDVYVRQGTIVERVYPGTRVTLKVTVSQRSGPVEPGTYQLYGTVTKIDPFDKRMTLGNAIFVPVRSGRPNLRP